MEEDKIITVIFLILNLLFQKFEAQKTSTRPNEVKIKCINDTYGSLKLLSVLINATVVEIQNCPPPYFSYKEELAKLNITGDKMTHLKLDVVPDRDLTEKAFDKLKITTLSLKFSKEVKSSSGCLKALANLEKLALTNVRFDSPLPDELELTSLTLINSSIPVGFGGCSKLINLVILDSELSETDTLPSVCNHLKSIKIERLQTPLPKSFVEPRNIINLQSTQELSIQGCSKNTLQLLPQWFRQVSIGLEKLDISNNQIGDELFGSIPFFKLRHVKEINFSHNNLTRINTSSNWCSMLWENVSFAHNPLGSEGIGNLFSNNDIDFKNIKSLYLDGTGVSIKSINNLTSLQYLSMTKNNLTQFDISDYKSIKCNNGIHLGDIRVNKLCHPVPMEVWVAVSIMILSYLSLVIFVVFIMIKLK